MSFFKIYSSAVFKNKNKKKDPLVVTSDKKIKGFFFFRVKGSFHAAFS